MNVEAIGRMEQFAREVLKLFPEQREQFFREMVDAGIMTKEEAEGLQNYVCYYRLFTDNRYYKAVKQAVGEMLWNTFKNKERD